MDSRQVSCTGLVYIVYIDASRATLADYNSLTHGCHLGLPVHRKTGVAKDVVRRLAGMLVAIAIVGLVGCAQGRQLASYIGHNSSGQSNCNNPDTPVGCVFQCKVAYEEEYYLCKNYEDRGHCLKTERCVSRFDQVKKDGPKTFYGACCCDETEHPYLRHIITSGNYSIYIEPILDQVAGMRPHCNIYVCERPYLAGSLTNTGPAICCNARESKAGIWLNNESQCCGKIQAANTSVDSREICCTTKIGKQCGWLETPWTWPREKLKTCCMGQSQGCSTVCWRISPQSMTWLGVVYLGVMATCRRWGRMFGTNYYEIMMQAGSYGVLSMVFFVCSLILQVPKWQFTLVGVCAVLAPFSECEDITTH
eukprot:4321252-Amphidinium_carterae.2